MVIWSIPIWLASGNKKFGYQRSLDYQDIPIKYVSVRWYQTMDPILIIAVLMITALDVIVGIDLRGYSKVKSPQLIGCGR